MIVRIGVETLDFVSKFPSEIIILLKRTQKL